MHSSISTFALGTQSCSILTKIHSRHCYCIDGTRFIYFSLRWPADKLDTSDSPIQFILPHHYFPLKSCIHLPTAATCIYRSATSLRCLIQIQNSPFSHLQGQLHFCSLNCLNHQWYSLHLYHHLLI